MARLSGEGFKRFTCPQCNIVLAAPLPPNSPAASELNQSSSATRDDSDPLAESQREPPQAYPALPIAPGLFLRPPQQPDELGRLGHFRVLKELGRGGMGMVFVAEDLRLLRSVALKVMLPEYAARPQARERFFREARIAASIENEHIITIFEVDEDNGVPYLTMPVLKGESLQARQHREGALPIPDILRIGWEICDGLQAAHDRKLVHRDLKPANIWLEGTKGRVKILDFGLARAETGDPHLTGSNVVLGTPSYMAPEQARNPHVDARADLFSLGVVLYRLTTGNLPFHGHDMMSMLFSITTDDPPPPRASAPAVPLELNNMTLKLLAKDPARRFESAEQVGLGLEAISQKYFGGRAIPSSELRMDQTQASVPIAKPVVSPSATQPAGPSPFQFQEPKGKLIVEPSSETPLPQTAPTAPRRPLPWAWLLAGMGGVLGIVLVWQIIIRITDEKGNVREVEVKKGEKLEIIPLVKKEAPVEGKKAAVENVADPDRRAALWALSLGGDVRLDQGGKVTDAKNLPSDSWKVEEIHLVEKQMTDAGLENLKGLTNLKVLSLANTKVGNGGLEHLKGLTKLTFLNLTGTQVTDAGLEHLKELLNLNHLGLHSTNVSDEGLKHLKGLANLRFLELTGTQVSDQGLKWLKGLTNLARLEVANTGLTDDGLAHLKGFQKLESLNLHGTKISDTGLDHIKGLTTLKQLSVSGPKVSDVGVEYLNGLTNLTYLRLSNSNVSDAGLAHLKVLTNLKYLYLGNTKVTDAGLERLREFLSLRELDLDRTNVTAEGVARLQKALPKCKIEWK